MTFEEFQDLAQRGNLKPIQNGTGFTCLCPGHDDHNPSLSVSRGNDGRILIHCHAGCDAGHVLAAMDLGPADLFPQNGAPSAGSGQAPPTPRRTTTTSTGRIVAVYPYTDENGITLFEVTRHEPKAFRQRTPDPARPGAYLPHARNVRKPLFRLPAVKAAIAAQKTVYVVEGEKDVLAAEKIGVVATTNPGGAGKFTVEHAESLRGARVVIIADRDDAGRDHAQDVRLKLLGAGVASAVVIEVADLRGPCKDLSDYVAAGGTVFGLGARARAAVIAAASQKVSGAVSGASAPTPPVVVLPEASDAERAQTFLARFAADVRYVPAWKRWIVWEGSTWNARDDGAVTRLCRVLAGEIMALAKFIRSSGKAAEEEFKAIAETAARFANVRPSDAMLVFARTDLRVIIRPSDVDADPWILGCPSCVVDLRTGAASAHARANIVTRLCAVDPDFTAATSTSSGLACPNWEAFLALVQPDPDVRAYLQKALGYALCGLTSEQSFHFLHGPGANGKTVLIETVFKILGDYARRAPAALLYRDASVLTPPHVIADVDGVRFLVGSEVAKDAKLNEGLIKDITSGDVIRGARKYEDAYDFTPRAKLWIYGNHKPSIGGTDDGIWRRVRLLRFGYRIPETAQDPSFAEKTLWPEAPAILAWLIKGASMWNRDGLKPPASVKAAVAEYRSEEDALGDFIDTKTEDFDVSTLTHAQLYDHYRAWCEKQGLKYPISSKKLSAALRDRGWESAILGIRNVLSWGGKKLKDSEPETPQTHHNKN